MPEHTNGGGALPPGPAGPARTRAWAAWLCAALTLAGAAGAAGCARMNATLGQQWIVVQFGPNTSLATARQVTRACSHVPNLPAEPVRALAGTPGLAGEARYNATRATDADMARLQRCLQRFPAVQGVNLSQPGDE